MPDPRHQKHLDLTGLTHDLLLEAGVFLVSVKLIQMAYRSRVSAGRIKTELQDIRNNAETIISY